MGIRLDSLLQLTKQNTADKTAKTLLIIFIFFLFFGIDDYFTVIF
ncbi:hypothetical protein M135_1364 [Bacteroides fragilis str. S36L5]|nr:hypothetical protein M137_1720 [Bacteroides fragilis str. S36L12]EYA91925.1 hypothetical protein M135_1364 [Bacteroides fragilis str. S36L5]